MNDAAFEAQKARIAALNARWLRPLGFGHWSVTNEWYREGLDSAFGPTPDGQAVLFHTTTEWDYLRVLIKVNLAEVEGLSDADLETHYLHEWGHAFLSVVLATPKGEARYRAVEHVCTWLGKAFRWVRVAGERDEKKRRKAKKGAK